MTIKVLGGLAQGRSLFIPKGNATRPTSVLLKRRIFDAFQYLDDFSFVDLCAGSGAMGIEAWSRGAKNVSLVESGRPAQKCIDLNIREIRKHFPDDIAERSISLNRLRAEQWIKKESWSEETIIFFDPPYEDHKLYKDVALTLLQSLNGAQLWLESDRQKGLPIEFWEKEGFTPDKTYSQGTSYFAIFRS